MVEIQSYLEVIKKYENFTVLSLSQMDRELKVGALLYPGIEHDYNSTGEVFFKNYQKNNALFFLELDFQYKVIESIIQKNEAILILEKYKTDYIIDSNSKLKGIFEWINNYSNKFLYYNNFTSTKYLKQINGLISDTKLYTQLGDIDDINQYNSKILVTMKIQVYGKSTIIHTGRFLKLYELTDKPINIEIEIRNGETTYEYAVISDQIFTSTSKISGTTTDDILYTTEKVINLTIQPEDNIVECIIDVCAFMLKLSKTSIIETMPIQQEGNVNFEIASSVPNKFIKTFFIKNINGILIEDEVKDGVITGMVPFGLYKQYDDKMLADFIIKNSNKYVDIIFPEIDNFMIEEVLYGSNAIDVVEHKITTNKFSLSDNKIIMNIDKAFAQKTNGKFDYSKMILFYPIEIKNPEMSFDYLITKANNIEMNVYVLYLDGVVTNLKIYKDVVLLNRNDNIETLGPNQYYITIDVDPLNPEKKQTKIMFHETIDSITELMYKVELKELILHHNYAVTENTLNGEELLNSYKIVSEGKTNKYYFWNGVEYIVDPDELNFDLTDKSIETIILTGSLSIQKTLNYFIGNVTIINNSLSDVKLPTYNIKSKDFNNLMLMDNMDQSISSMGKSVYTLVGDARFLREWLIFIKNINPNFIVHSGNVFTHGTIPNSRNVIINNNKITLNRNPIIELINKKFITTSDSSNMVPITLKLKEIGASNNDAFTIKMTTNYSGLPINYLGVSGE